jgi:hypothetical protein
MRVAKSTDVKTSSHSEFSGLMKALWLSIFFMSEMTDSWKTNKETKRDNSGDRVSRFFVLSEI